MFSSKSELDFQIRFILIRPDGSEQKKKYIFLWSLEMLNNNMLVFTV